MIDTSSLQIALIDDDASVLEATRHWLELSGFSVMPFAGSQEAVAAIGADFPGVVVSDIRMPALGGLEVMRIIHEKNPSVPVVLITGHGDIPMAVEAMRAGAWDFLEKPFDPERLEDVVRRALIARGLQLENQALKEHSEDPLAQRLIGASQQIRKLRQQISRLGAINTHVLVQGETGTGKEVVARLLHETSTRRDKPFVAINCGALARELIESELFGHQKGAFTGATGMREGKLEHASGGTLFLDEIESMPMDAQVKLLRAIQEQEIERVGSNSPIKIDLRVVAATKTDLLALSEQGEFRDDLYYRLAVAELTIPPLRARPDDILPLFRHFVRQIAEVHSLPPAEPDAALCGELLHNPWRGNVRELRNAATRFALSLDQHAKSGEAETEAGGLAAQVAAFEQLLISQALIRHGGNIQAVLEELKLPRRTLNQKMLRHGLRRDLLDDSPE